MKFNFFFKKKCIFQHEMVHCTNNQMKKSPDFPYCIYLFYEGKLKSNNSRAQENWKHGGCKFSKPHNNSAETFLLNLIKKLK